MTGVLLSGGALGGPDGVRASGIEDAFVIPIWSDVVGGTAEKEDPRWILNRLEFWHHDTGRPSDPFVDPIGGHKFLFSPALHSEFDRS